MIPFLCLLQEPISFQIDQDFHERLTTTEKHVINFINANPDRYWPCPSWRWRSRPFPPRPRFPHHQEMRHQRLAERATCCPSRRRRPGRTPSRSMRSSKSCPRSPHHRPPFHRYHPAGGKGDQGGQTHLAAVPGPHGAGGPGVRAEAADPWLQCICDSDPAIMQKITREVPPGKLVCLFPLRPHRGAGQGGGERFFPGATSSAAPAVRRIPPWPGWPTSRSSDTSTSMYPSRRGCHLPVPLYVISGSSSTISPCRTAG